MANIKSRSEIHKQQVDEVNKKLARSKAETSIDTYIASTLESLKKIDKDFFKKVETKLLNEYQNNKFKLEHESENADFNYEILYSILDSLDQLRKIEEHQAANSKLYAEKSEIIFSKNDYHKKELEDIYEELFKKNVSYIDKRNSSEAYKTNYAGDKNATLAKSLLTSEESIKVNKILKEKTISENINTVKQNQRLGMHNLTQNKKRFKIKTKLFYAVAISFLLISLVGLIILITI